MEVQKSSGVSLLRDSHMPTLGWLKCQVSVWGLLMHSLISSQVWTQTGLKQLVHGAAVQVIDSSDLLLPNSFPPRGLWDVTTVIHEGQGPNSLASGSWNWSRPPFFKVLTRIQDCNAIFQNCLYLFHKQPLNWFHFVLHPLLLRNRSSPIAACFWINMMQNIAVFWCLSP